MKLMACAVVAMSMLAGAAQAGEWRYTGVSNDTAYFVDTSTIRNIPYSQKKVAWTAQLLASTSGNGSDYYLIQYEFDCAAMTQADLSFHRYSIDGSILGSENNRLPSNPVIPDTFGYSVFKSVCDGTDSPPFETVQDALEKYRQVLAEMN